MAKIPACIYHTVSDTQMEFSTINNTVHHMLDDTTYILFWTLSTLLAFHTGFNSFSR